MKRQAFTRKTSLPKKYFSENVPQVLAMLDGLPDIFICFDSGWNITYINKAAGKYLKKKKKDIIGKNIWKLYPQWKKQHLYKYCKKASLHQELVEFEYYSSLHEWHFIQIFPSKESTCIYMKNITSRKKSEEEVYTITERYRLAAKAISDVIWDWDLATDTTQWNTSVQTVFGFTSDEAEKNPLWWNRMIHPRDRTRVVHSIQNAVGKNKTVWQEEYRFKKKDGNYVWVSDRGFIVKDSFGNPIRMVGSMQDISSRKKTEVNLRENEQMLQEMADTVPVMIWMSSAKRGNVYFNKTWLDFRGRPLSEELRNAFHEGIHPDDLKKSIMEYNTAKKNRESFISEYRLRRHDGVYRWVLDTGTPRFSKSGNFLGYIGSCVDIHERKELEEQLQTFQFISEHANDMYFLTKEDRLFVYVNQAACQELGYKKEELLKLHVADIDIFYEKDRFKNLSQELQKGKSSPFESVLKRKDGSTFPVEISTSSLIINKEYYFFSIVRNITNRKESETTLMRINTILSSVIDGTQDAIFIKDIQGRYTMINSTVTQIAGRDYQDIIGKSDAEIYDAETAKQLYKNDQLIIKHGKAKILEETISVQGKKRIFLVTKTPLRENGTRIEGIIGIAKDITQRKELEERKDDFISTASHELKTPLTSIKAFSQILYHKFKDSEDTKSLYILSRIDSQVGKLTSLVNDLLDVSRIQGGRMQLEKTVFPLDDLIREVVNDVQVVTQAKHTIVFHKVCDTKVVADKYRIGQVVANLLTNAIKYSPDSTQVTVTAEISDKKVIVSVTDQGIGIPKNKQTEVFERFFRVNPNDYKAGGFTSLGLGLYISTEIVKRHGGKIWIKSQEGKGSTFYFTIPFAQLSAR